MSEENSMGKPAVYVGDDDRLLGEMCLVRRVSEGKVLAQFDNRDLKESIGWHEFDFSDFDFDLGE